MPTQLQQEEWNSCTISVDTPTGKMFVHILEEDGKPVRVLISLGKAGTEAAAWASSISSLITAQLQDGNGINTIIQSLSLQHGDRISHNSNGINIRSGPDGICYALLQYRKAKFQELRETLDGYEENDRYLER